MSDPFDEIRFEHERLMRMGRDAPDQPTPRQVLTARMIDPSAWSVHAEEHIAWCTRHGLTSSTSHFGGQYLISRRVAMIRAGELLRRLDRQAAGLPDLEPFDPMAMSSALEKEAFALHLARRNRYVSHKAAKAVFFMKDVHGVPAPVPSMSDDGSVTLTWSEDDRRAIVSIDVDGGMTLSIPGSDEDTIPLDFMTWRNADGPRIVTAVTDWIHFGGTRPVLRPDDQPTIATTD